MSDHQNCSAGSAVEHMQARGRHYDIIREAIAAYDEYMLDDDYDAQRTLDSIVKKMRERTALTDAPVIPDDIQTQVTEQQIEDGAKVLFGEGWDKTATPANRRYCREKAKAIFAAMAAQTTDKIQSTTPAQACAVRLEARLANNSNDWTEIFPSQLEWVAKAGHQVRAIEVAAQPPAAPVETKWECMGRKQALPEPGECNWPDCGCDPHATKVIESLIEQGWQAPAHPRSSADRETVAEIIYNAFPFEARHGLAHKPAWVKGGNSIHQDDARRAADLIRALPQEVAVTDAAQFLLDRLDEFDPGEDEPEREYHGHVAPAIARLRSALSRPLSRGGE